MVHTGFIRKLLLHHQHKPFPIPVLLQWLLTWLLHWLLLILVSLCKVYLEYLVYLALGHLVYLEYLVYLGYLVYLLLHTPSKAVAPPLAHWDLTRAPQLHWEVALQVMVLLQMMDSQNFTSCHQSKTIVSLGYKPPVELHQFSQIYHALRNNPASLPLPAPPVELCLQKV